MKQRNRGRRVLSMRSDWRKEHSPFKKKKSGEGTPDLGLAAISSNICVMDQPSTEVAIAPFA